jgi:capsular polysaccharide biosynthesis protein
VQVRAYAEVFFSRYTELQDYEKHMKQIERGEQKIQRQHDIMKARPCRLQRTASPCVCSMLPGSHASSICHRNKACLRPV